MIKGNIGKIQFNYLENSFYLPARTQLKAFIVELFKQERVRIALVNYVFCSDDYLLKVNKEFLSHDTYTDIITFQYAWPPQPVSSDIYISIERVRENAAVFQISILKELYRVIFHGALHLCGYKDKSKAEAQLMRSKEDFYLERYVSRGTKKSKGLHI